MSMQENLTSKVVVAASLAFAISASLVAQTGSVTRTSAAAPQPSASADTAKYRALVNKYCLGCHNAHTANPADPVN